MLANVKKTVSPMPAILREAQVGAQMNYNKFLNIVMALMLMLIATGSELAVLFPVVFIRVIMAAMASGGAVDNLQLDLYSQDMVMLQLFVTILPIVVLMLYVKFGEKRSIRTMGFVKEHAVTDYLIGMAAAFAMFSACVGICVATGAMTFEGYVLNGQYGLLGLFFLGFLVQGMSEEVVCRGFIMTSVGSKSGVLAGMLLNSLIFGALHLFNSGVTVFSIVNIVLFGVFMSIVVLKLNSLWAACALHSVWNFVQGNFYGILVSGIDAGPSVFRFAGVSGGTLWNGGSFGMEGGLATTLVLTVSIMIALMMKPREKNIALGNAS